MLHITLHITYDRRVMSRLASLGLVLLLCASGSWLPSVSRALASPALGAFSATSGRHVYLTASTYLPVDARSACAGGYQMASFWEIMDVSNLIYDYNHPAAVTQDDSGHSLPSYLAGWVRTGYSSSSTNMAGTTNCNNWTSSNAADYGTAVYLSRQWETVSSQADLWTVYAYSCGLVAPVWCVRVIYALHLPLITRDL
jgi:hypothetical protein